MPISRKRLGRGQHDASIREEEAPVGHDLRHDEEGGQVPGGRVGVQRHGEVGEEGEKRHVEDGRDRLEGQRGQTSSEAAIPSTHVAAIAREEHLGRGEVAFEVSLRLCCYDSSSIAIGE